MVPKSVSMSPYGILKASGIPKPSKTIQNHQQTIKQPSKSHQINSPGQFVYVYPISAGSCSNTAGSAANTAGCSASTTRSSSSTNRGSYKVKKYFRKHTAKTVPTNQIKMFHMATGRIDWTEMTGNTFRIFLDPVSGPFGLTKWQNLGNS